MSENIEISRQKPENKSMDYEFLREEGIKYIQELASKIWTDYNPHDPGITILEALCYAITDLGYRASFPIKDIIATEHIPGVDDEEIKNFYKAEEILPNAPLNTNDYRKLLMDIEIEVNISGSDESELVGVKNAWIRISDKAEQSFYLVKSEGSLSYEADPDYDPIAGQEGTDQPSMKAGNLYDVLLEFSDSDFFDDLNHNTIDGYLTIYDNPNDTNLEGLIVSIDLTLPRWDTEGINWNDFDEVKSNIQKVNIQFQNLPNNYELTATVNEEFIVSLEGTITTSGSVDDLREVDLESLTDKINSFLGDITNPESLIILYQQKINVIQSILDEVKSTLNANRNLCDDFYKPSALKVEEIGICADFQVELDSDIEKLQAQIYYEIDKFLSPTINFYSLSEMLDLCKSVKSFSITEIDKKNKIFTVNKDITEKLIKGDNITISNSTSNNGTYTVKKLSKNQLLSGYSDVEVDEDIPSDVLTEGELLSYTFKNEDECLTVDQIFEGPLLKHGFIDTSELEGAELLKYIHVSDLIQIVMDIPGIIAVKNLEIASYPEDPEYDTVFKSVKWVLDLTSEDNYVPRLSIDKSTVIFYKDQIPYKAEIKEVEDLINEFEDDERPQKLTPPIVYPKVPKGEYKILEDFTSIQEDFPMTYGIGYEGIPNLSNLSTENQRKRIMQVRQLKGYLMFFDQLLANYLSQLANVKYLFSMNSEKDEFGEFEIGRTYFTQTLFDIVSNSDPLYVNKDGHKAELELLAENETLFNTRRNKFLDHLLARFAENFTDYAMLMTRVSGNKAPRELIDDKLNFLNKYPDISSNRGLAFNYNDACRLWHIDNKSGLEKRTSLLMGSSPKQANLLMFSPGFDITLVGDSFAISIESGGEILLSGTENQSSEETAKDILEFIILNGLQNANYEVKSDNGSDYYFNLKCGEKVLATSQKTDYSSKENAQIDIDILIGLFDEEFFNNHESNRNNLTPPIDNYFTIDYELIENDENYYQVEISLCDDAFVKENKLLTSIYNINVESVENEEDVISYAKKDIWKIIINGVLKENYIFNFDEEENYIFHITDRDAGVLATSVESNFNAKLTNLISGFNNPLVKILGSTENDGYFEIDSSEDVGPNVILHINDSKAIPSTTSDGDLSITASYACITNSSDLSITVNQDITEELNEFDLLVLVGNELEDTYYSIKNYEFNEGNTKITVNEALDSGGDLNLIILKSYSYSLDEDNRIFTIDEDITNINKVGDILTMWKDIKKVSEFTIKSINRYGDKTQVQVKEKIEKDKRGHITFTKIYPQVRIETPLSSTSIDDTNAFTIKGGEDDKAVQEMIRFIKEKFIEKEGVHLVEHVLLRPKFNEYIPVLTGELSANGNIQFRNSVPIIINDAESEIVGVEGDIVSEFNINLFAGTVNLEIAGYIFSIDSENIYYSGSEGATIIDLEELYPPGLEGEGDETIYLSYLADIPIEGINGAEQKILVSGASIQNMNPGDTFNIENSPGFINDGTYIVKSTDNDGIFIVLELIQDKLLPIFLSDDCNTMNLTNPYTSIVTVVLPYWPERYNNMDFRNFFDKTLRLEAPSHVLLKICWVNPLHMEDFERTYKKWLIEINDKQSTKIEISDSLNCFIEAIDNLRNVYPAGTLYDPKEHQTLKNTIILDNTMLGSF
ncbi:MAG: hypothetical protein GQ564_05885 [Bacteroidales bacterium]|nr:hypothetical protein [Bacteroidales bacterium]